MPSLASRIWLATITKAHAAFAAEHGFGLITNYRPSELTTENAGYLDVYRQICRARGHVPRIGMSRGILAVDDESKARAEWMPQAIRFSERGRRMGWLPDTATPETFFSRDDFHFGTPQSVVDKLTADVGRQAATVLLTGLLSAHVTPRQLLPVVSRVAREIAPAIGWRPAARLAS